MTDRRADRLLAGTLRLNLWRNLGLVLLALAGAVGMLMIPAAVAAAVDTRLSGEGNGALWSLFAAVLLVALTTVGLQLMTPLCVADATIALRARYLGHLLRLKVPEGGASTTGDLTMRITSATAVAASIVPLPGRFLASLMVCLGGLVALWLIDPLIGCAFLVGVPAAFLLMKTFVGEVTPVLERQLAAQGRVSGLLLEVLAGIRSVRAAGKEHEEVERVLGPLPDLLLAR